MPFENKTREYTFVKKVANGDLIFLCGTTGRPQNIGSREFAKLVGDKVAVQIHSSSWVDRIDIHALVDPSLPNVPVGTKKKILAAQEKIAEAAMYMFYAVRIDAAGDSISDATITKYYGKALASGHIRRPSASGLGRALKKGVPHERCIADFISLRGKHSKRKYNDPWVHQKLAEAVERFYSEGNPKPPSLLEAVTTFQAQAIIESRERIALGQPALKFPKHTAVGDHIREQETEERLRRRDPIEAQKKYGSRAQGATAQFPLQHVQVDQTQIDTHINIYDEDGNVVERKRPYLVSIIDVYSRMILAAILTFDKPSSYTVQLAIKQMLRPKLFLINRFPGYKAATDGSGQPKGMTFDNAGENVCFTMRTLLGDAGIDLEAAPVATG